ncbi:hypothetical protein ABZ478_38235 [Streptomyces sp. NPDC005706]|uniref:hypothetical protein n=1 Tax=Streptomyces sp. NPDC005706 TaxID=3157169 RepID=UPI0033E0E095
MSDRATPIPAPDLDEVAAQWQALITGDVTREAIHAWAAAWVEDEGDHHVPPLVLGALQHLHGFDLCRDPDRPGVVWHGTADEGEWVHSPDEIAEGFARWQDRCDLKHAGPQPEDSC